jgi:hypothetical protein
LVQLLLFRRRVKATATYFRGPHREDGELVLDHRGLGFYRTERRSGFSFSLNGLGFSSTTTRNHVFTIPPHEVLDIRASPEWPEGVYVHTPHGILSFGLAEPQALVRELARLRAG